MAGARDKAIEQLERFAEQLERSNRALARDGQPEGVPAGPAQGGQSSEASKGSSDALRTARDLTEAGQLLLATVREVASAAGPLGASVGTLASVLGEAVTKVQGALQSLETSRRASGSVTSQLAPFALAGVEIPDAVLDQVAAVETARSQQLTDLENRARAATSIQMVRLQLDQAKNALSFGGFGGF